jgi:hypothetical protein
MIFVFLHRLDRLGRWEAEKSVSQLPERLRPQYGLVVPA